MKQIKTALSVVAALGGMVATSQANLVVNGDFEAGDTGFTSGHSSVVDMHDPGAYRVGYNPNSYHSAWVSMGDHTSGNGQMLIVNGAETAGANVWSGTLVSALTVGQTYRLSVWAANVYDQNNANLEISFGGVVLGNLTPTGLGSASWQEFAATFVATADQTSDIINLQSAYFGNDFAVDDISLAAVPEPTTFLAGGLLLLPFAASTLRVLPRRGMA